MNGFIVIPAVDIRNGCCVRLVQGEPGRQTVFDEDPLRAAKIWQEEGAELIHVVDLDGAFEGRPVNFSCIKSVAESVSVPVQVGGGIRSKETAKAYLRAGVSRVIVGTGASGGTGFIESLVSTAKDRLAVGIDIKDGRVAIEGWKESAEENPAEMVGELASLGVPRLIYTSVSRDGTMSGPDLEGIEKIARVSPIPVIASGGVGSVEDVMRIYRLRDLGIEGVIIGMALYRGRFTLEEVNEAIQGL